MYSLYKILEHTLEAIKSEGIEPSNIEKSDFSKFYNILDKLPYLIWFTGPTNPIYLNRKGREYYNVSLEDIKNDGNLVFSKYMHPDTLFLVSQTNQSFALHPEKEVSACYKVYDVNRDERWVTNITKALKLNEKTGIDHAIHISIDLNEILDKSDFVRDLKTIDTSILPNLSNREHEVLKLIAKEFTTAQIAHQLFIGKDAVNFHRKNLLKKFEVSTSIGLVLKALKYSLI